MIEWRPVVGWEGSYSVSSDGQVRSETRLIPHKGTYGGYPLKGRVLQLCMDTYGYHAVNFRRNNKLYRRKVHRLVLEAFVGPCPPGLQCRHMDGDPTNNHIGNLRWGTRVENAADAVEQGRVRRGPEHHVAKLTEEKVRVLLDLRSQGASLGTIAEMIGVTRGTVSAVLRGRTWRHVTGLPRLAKGEPLSGAA